MKMQKVLGKRDACGGGGTVDTDDLCSLADGLKEEVRFAGCVSVVGTGGCRADWLKPACWRELKALKWCHPCLILFLSYFHIENKHLIQYLSNSANISEQTIGHLMLWNVTLGHLSFLCV